MIPYNKPPVTGKEQAYIGEAIRAGHLSGDGPFTRKASRLLEDIFPRSKAMLTTSCTHALEMAALLLDLKQGDEVIVPSFTFVSTVNAFVLRGAKPVFVDIRPDTLNLDERLVEAAITPRTKAIFLVHYAGIACEMDAFQDIAERHGLVLVEDAAHAIGARYKGKPLGTFGALATLSFHETKNITCGEGGALLINHPGYRERAEILREKGTNRSRFFRGEVDKYSWVDVGSSYLPSDMLAAYLTAQLEELESINAERIRIFNTYHRSLTDFSARFGLRLPTIPESCQPNGHLFYLLFPTMSLRDQVMATMKQNGVSAVFHYLPLHLATFGQQYGLGEGDLPVTERVSSTLLRLPLFKGMTDEEQEQVLRTLQEAVEKSL